SAVAGRTPAAVWRAFVLLRTYVTFRRKRAFMPLHTSGTLRGSRIASLIGYGWVFLLGCSHAADLVRSSVAGALKKPPSMPPLKKGLHMDRSFYWILSPDPVARPLVEWERLVPIGRL